MRQGTAIFGQSRTMENRARSLILDGCKRGKAIEEIIDEVYEYIGMVWSETAVRKFLASRGMAVPPSAVNRIIDAARRITRRGLPVTLDSLGSETGKHPDTIERAIRLAKLSGRWPWDDESGGETARRERQSRTWLDTDPATVIHRRADRGVRNHPRES